MPVSRTRLAAATSLVLAAAIVPAGAASAAAHHPAKRAAKHPVATTHKKAGKAKKKASGAGIRKAVNGAARSFASADGTSIGTITSFDAATGRIRITLEDGSVVRSRLSPSADVRCAPASGFAAEADPDLDTDLSDVLEDARSAGYEDGYSDGAGAGVPDPAGADGLDPAALAAYAAAYATGFRDGLAGVEPNDPGDPSDGGPNDGDGCLDLVAAGLKVYGVAVKVTPSGRAITELDVIVSAAQLAALNAADDAAAAVDPAGDEPESGEDPWADDED